MGAMDSRRISPWDDRLPSYPTVTVPPELPVRLNDPKWIPWVAVTVRVRCGRPGCDWQASEIQRVAARHASHLKLFLCVIPGMI
jgi:hypothetical protein